MLVMIHSMDVFVMALIAKGGGERS